MKRMFILMMELAVAALRVPACGGGGGGGGSIGSTSVLKSIALFADDSYVDYDPGDSGSEAALRDMGHTVTPFTGVGDTEWSAALSGREVLVVPELENGQLGADISSEAKDSIKSFVNRSGILFVTLDYMLFDFSLEFLNSTFGYSMAGTELLYEGEALSYSSTEAAGTGFEGAVPATVPANNGTYLVDPAGIPSAARVIYSSAAGNAALIYIPYGKGHIVISGYDWYEGKPVADQDGGWWGILYRAVSLNADHPNVFFLSGIDTLSWRYDVVNKLMQTGQFNSVAQTYIDLTIPTLPEISAYDALLVCADGAVADTQALGSILADHVDSGGGVVLTGFSFYGMNNSPTDRFLDDNYYVIPYGTSNIWSANVLGTVDYNFHPIMAGVMNVDQGLNIAATNLVPGSAMIARWDHDGAAVGTRMVNGFRRADLGFYPVSTDQYAAGWDTATDGAILIANALTWTANLPEPDYQTTVSADSFPMPLDSPEGSNCDLESTLTVTGGPEFISKVTVTVNIAHTWLSDVDISLESPEGTILDISSDNGGVGDDYSNVTFDDAAGTAIGGLGSTFTPFTGPMIPEEALAALRGENSNGTWTLHLVDDVCFMDGGVGLQGWSLDVR